MYQNLYHIQRLSPSLFRESVKEGPDPSFSLLFTRIPNVVAILKNLFLPNPALCPHFSKSRFPCPNLGSREYPFRPCFRLLTIDTVSFQFATFPTSMMTVFVMTLGELSYEDRFMPWDSLEYATLANILFFMFVLGMPIILMNMLVSMPFR